MKWLLVRPAASGYGALEDLQRELEAHGQTVRAVVYRRRNVLYKNKGVKGLYIRWILRGIVRVARVERPEIILVNKGETLGPDFLRRLKAETGAVLINLFGDNPLLTIPFECLEPYDLVLSKERYGIRALELAGLRNLYYLPHYCDPALHHPVELTPAEKGRYGAEVSFVGHHYPYRERFFRELADLPLAIWGRGWERAASPEVRRLGKGASVEGRALLAVFSGSRINLNLHHPLNDIVGVNDRTFFLAGSRAFQLVDWKADLGSFFKEGEEIVTYRSPEECRRLIAYYRAHPDEAAAIALNAQRRAYRDHTCRQRVEELLDVVASRFGKGGG